MLPKSPPKKTAAPAQKSGQQAWLKGLPHHKADVRLRVQSATSPKPHTSFITVNIIGDHALLRELRALSRARTVLPALSLVVRTDAARELDNAYQMTSALIEEIKAVKGLPGLTTVNISFNKISMRTALTGNPGPPDDAPPVRAQGPNTGWMFRAGTAIPLQVLDFTAPHFDGRVRITLGEPSSEIQSLKDEAVAPPELILVLPDRAQQHYVELKLREPGIRLQENGRQAVFEADWIEILTG
jgi:hypothetical protein